MKTLVLPRSKLTQQCSGMILPAARCVKLAIGQARWQNCWQFVVLIADLTQQTMQVAQAEIGRASGGGLRVAARTFGPLWRADPGMLACVLEPHCTRQPTHFNR